MNIARENIDALNAVLKLNIAPEDYDAKVNEILKDYRKKANMPGFRPGKVPASIIDRMYKKPVMAEEINKIMSESIGKYLTDEKVNILGNPLPHESEQNTIDWDNQKEFEFSFDLGLAPEVNVDLSDQYKVPFYDINIDEKIIDDTVKNYTGRFGKLEPADVAEKDGTVKGTISQLDEKGEVVEKGLSAENASIYLNTLDEESQKLFVDKKAGDTVVFDIKKVYKNESEIARIFNINKKVAEGVSGNFQVKIEELSKYVEAEINQELFDKVFGKDTVKTEEEFRNKIKEQIQSNFEYESEFRFHVDAEEIFVDKIGMELPDAFLKRLMLYNNEGKVNQDDVEKEYPRFEKNLRWQLIKKSIAQANNIEVTEEEIKEEAKKSIKNQFAQYGYYDIPEEELEKYAAGMLKKDEDRDRLADKKIEEKIIALVKEKVKIDHKKVSLEDFNKLYQEKK